MTGFSTGPKVVAREAFWEFSDHRSFCREDQPPEAACPGPRGPSQNSTFWIFRVPDGHKLALFGSSAYLTVTK